MNDRYEVSNTPDEMPADRGMPSILKKSTLQGKNSHKQTLVFIIIGAALLLILYAVNGGFSREQDDMFSEGERTSNTQIINRLGPSPALPAPPPPPQAERNEIPNNTLIQTGQIVQTPSVNSQDSIASSRQRKLQSSILAYGSTSGASSGVAQLLGENPILPQATSMVRDDVSSLLGSNNTVDALNTRLSPTVLEGVSASLLRERSYFITQGTFLDCALETALSSDVPGMTSCRLTRDIYSTDSRVLLLERGSKVIGQYQGGLQRGQVRIFVLWTRVETPTGVIVNLDSPGTDALGRSGLNGYVDNHFWNRFGGAIMLSLVDDIGTYAANEASSGDNNQIQLGGITSSGQDIASIALENSINIPPTLIKNQGEKISIFVARDLDFRGVYDLKVTR